MAGSVPETAPTPQIPSSFKYTPLEALRTIFLQFLQGLFNAAPSGCYHWEADDNLTEIIIQNEGTLREEVISKRPALVLVRGPIQFSTLSLDDMESYDADIGRKTKSVIVSGSVTINAVSRVDIESEKIAWIVMEHCWLLREILLRQGFFETGRGLSMGAPSPAGSIVADDKGDEYVATPVMVPLQFVRQSSFMPLGADVVGNIIHNITANIPVLPTGSGPPPVSGAEYPVSVQRTPYGSFDPGASDAFGRSPDPAGGQPDRLPKIYHPLHPDVEVTVRQVSPYRRRGG